MEDVQKNIETGARKKSVNENIEVLVDRPDLKENVDEGSSSNEAGHSKLSDKLESFKRRVAATRPDLGSKTNKDPGISIAGPSAPSYQTRRRAFRTVRQLKDLPSAVLTERQLSKLAWARMITDTRPSSSSDNVVSKRQRSQEESPASNKKAKVTATVTRPFNEVLKDQLVVAVIDQSSEEGSTGPAKWGKVEMALATNFFQVLKENPGPVPCCRDRGWYRNQVKLIACADQRSLCLYKKAVDGLGEVWPGARLRVVSMEDIPRRPRARAWIPAEPSDPRMIMDLLRVSNPTIKTDSWRVVKVEEAREDHRSAVILVDRESLVELAKTSGIVSYGFGSITLKVYKRDEADRVRDPVVADAEGTLRAGSSGAASLSDARRGSMEDEVVSLDTDMALSINNMSRWRGESDSEESDITVVEVEGGNHESDPNQSPPQ